MYSTLRLLTIGLFFSLTQCGHYYRQVKEPAAASSPWHSGSVETAFQKAKAQKRPILLYWGAKWCPPCHELKNNVLNRPRFAELMQSIVAIRLDGDKPEAQRWGEKLGVMGYPTVLVLGPSGEEWLRIGSSVTLDEFEHRFQTAINNAAPLEVTLKKALANRASEQEWKQLAYFNWENAKILDTSSEKGLRWQEKLIAQIPAKLSTEKALLTAKLLEAAFQAKDMSTAKGIRVKAGSLLPLLWATPAATYATRTTLLYSPELLKWIYPIPSERRREVAQTWLEAVSRIQRNLRFSEKVRLWTVHPKIVFHQMNHGKSKPFPKKLVKEVKAAARQADRSAATSYQRHALIPSAAHLLGLVGEVELARQLLSSEASQSKTPFFYYAGLARLEEKQGNSKKALDWAKKARLSARGRATRIQWIELDLQLTSRLDTDPNQKRLKSIAHEYHEQLLELDDAFSGRNFRSTQKVKKWLGKIQLDWQSYADRCGRFQGETLSRCHSHFASLAKR